VSDEFVPYLLDQPWTGAVMLGAELESALRHLVPATAALGENTSSTRTTSSLGD
jgi:hypothetical protein